MDFDAFILIGGRSSRFGSDKALADLGSVTLAENAARLIGGIPGCANVTLVSANETQFADAQMPLNVIADKNPGFGSWSGLQTALAASKREMTFVLACDLPLLSKNLLEKLVKAVQETNSKAAVPLQPDGRLQPLCGIYRTKPVLAAVNAKIESNERLPSLISFVREIEAAVVEPAENEDENVFLNVNTREDLEKARRLSS